jgi:hypothetical protein
VFCGRNSACRAQAADIEVAAAKSAPNDRAYPRAEIPGPETSMTAANDLAVRRALEMAGVEFVDENGGGPGLHLRKLSQGKHRM